MGKIEDSYTVTGAAELLNLHRDTLEKAMSSGQLVPELTRDGAKLLTVRELNRWRRSVKKGRPRKTSA